MGTAGLFPPRIKRPEYEADHSFPTSAEVKKTWIYTSIPRKSSWCGADVVKHRDNFAFYL
jgi:hypothetical protein